MRMKAPWIQVALKQQQQALQKKLGAPDYGKTPEHIQAGDREKGSKVEQELESVETALRNLNIKA